MKDILKNEVCICTIVLEEEDIVYHKFSPQDYLEFLITASFIFLCFLKWSLPIVGYSSLLPPTQKHSLVMET